MSMRGLWAATVWAPNGVPAKDWRYRGIYRGVLPLTDIFFLWFGAAGWWFGVQSVQEATSLSWQVYWSAALALFALLALIGVSFPKLWLLELVAKVPLISLLSVYIFVLIIRGIEMPQVTATSGLVCVLILLPMWRVLDLSGNLWQYRWVRYVVNGVLRPFRWIGKKWGR